VVSLTLTGNIAWGKKPSRAQSIYYLKNVYGLVHQGESNSTTSLTTLACGHPIRVLKSGENNSDWFSVKVGPYSGHMNKSFLSRNRVKCIQDLYTTFWNKLNLEVSDFYYWGRLYDQYEYGKSRVR